MIIEKMKEVEIEMIIEKIIQGKGLWGKYYNKYIERNADYNINRNDKYDNFRRYSRSNSINKDKDYYGERNRNKIINLLEGEKYHGHNKYKKRDNYYWKKRGRKKFFFKYNKKRSNK